MQTQKPLISVIVPVYNVGEFLAPCLDSLISQTYENIEVLLIDDGSTDGSGVCCDNYVAKEPRFKVLHKENGGVSSACNIALDMATGDYIAFVDADDRLLPDYFDTLYRDIVEQDADAALCNFCNVDEDGNPLPEGAVRFKENERIADWERLLLMHAEFGVVWGGLFSAKDIRQNRFSNLRYGEDTLFAFGWVCTNPVVSVDTYAGYLYVQRKNSATGTKKVSAVQKKLEHLEVHAYQFLNLPLVTPNLKKCYLNKYAEALRAVVNQSVLSDCPKGSVHDLRKHLCKILADIRFLTKKNAVWILLYKTMPWLYTWLVRANRRKSTLRGE